MKFTEEHEKQTEWERKEKPFPGQHSGRGEDGKDQEQQKYYGLHGELERTEMVIRR